MIGDGVAVIRCDRVVLRKRSIPGWRSCENGVCAKIVGPSSTVVTSSARDTGLDGYPVTGLEVLDSAADFDNGAG